MAKTYKVVSHVERMKNAKLGRHTTANLTAEYVNELAEEQIVNDGRICTTIKAKKVDPREKMAKWKVTDFCIENLQASGALAGLSHTALNGNVIQEADNVTKAINTLENINISNE